MLARDIQLRLLPGVRSLWLRNPIAPLTSFRSTVVRLSAVRLRKPVPEITAVGAQRWLDVQEDFHSVGRNQWLRNTPRHRAFQQRNWHHTKVESVSSTFLLTILSSSHTARLGIHARPA